MEGLSEEDVLHNNSISEDEGFRDWIPIQTNTCQSYVTGPKSRWLRGKNWMKKGENKLHQENTSSPL